MSSLPDEKAWYAFLFVEIFCCVFKFFFIKVLHLFFPRYFLLLLSLLL